METYLSLCRRGQLRWKLKHLKHGWGVEVGRVSESLTPSVVSFFLPVILFSSETVGGILFKNTVSIWCVENSR